MSNDVLIRVYIHHECRLDHVWGPYRQDLMWMSHGQPLTGGCGIACCHSWHSSAVTADGITAVILAPEGEHLELEGLCLGLPMVQTIRAVNGGSCDFGFRNAGYQRDQKIYSRHQPKKVWDMEIPFGATHLISGSFYSRNSETSWEVWVNGCWQYVIDDHVLRILEEFKDYGTTP